MTPVRRIATVLGLVYTVVAIVGFAVSGFDAFAAPRGDLLLFFTVNPLQNLIHLAIGWWLVNAALAGEREASSAAFRGAVAIMVLGLAGVYLTSRMPERNFLNANAAVNLAHLLSAGATFLALAFARATTGPRSAA
jgi:hypothetical protein